MKKLYYNQSVNGNCRGLEKFPLAPICNTLCSKFDACLVER